ncbi:MAG: Gldg family protein [Ruminococcus sp.]|nr:Gldg family protein [Ruminococcus sp.]
MNKRSSKKPSSKKGFKQFITARNTRRGATSVGITVLLIAAIVLVNAVLAILSDRSAMYIDVTANRNFKLQSMTIDYIKTLDKDVDIYVLAAEEDLENNSSANYAYYVQANRLLHEFDYNSDKIHLHYVDLVKDPTFLTAYPNVNRSQSHMMLVSCGENYTTLDPTDVFGYDTETYQDEGYMVVQSQHVEQSVTSAILKVSDAERVTVSVLTGLDEEDCSAFAARLSMNAYDVETVNLYTGQISEKSQFLIIYKPLADIDKDLYDTISKWLDNDGKYGHHVIYFPNDDVSAELFPNLNTLLADYGMEVDYAYIFEKDTDHLVPGNNLNNSLFDYADADFTADLANQEKKIIMGGVRGTMPIKILDPKIASSMLVSSEDVERFDIKSQTLGEYDGAMCGAAIGRKGGASGVNSSVVAVGSYYAISNLYLTANTYNNSAYFINMFNVLSEKQDTGILIEGKDPTSTELGVSSKGDLTFLSALVRFILPGLVLIAGLVVWIRRRHQ